MDTVSGGNTNRGDGSEKWFSGLANGERQPEPYGSSERKHNLSYEKSGITMVRRPCQGPFLTKKKNVTIRDI